MKIIISQLKAEAEGFNNMPSKAQIESYFLENVIVAKFVDVTDKEFWENKYDTIVFRVSSIQTALDVGKFALEWGADEFDFIRNKPSEYIVRLWWD